MKKKKTLSRVLCLFLAVLLTVCAWPALTVFADGDEAGEGGEGGEVVAGRTLQSGHDYTRDEYATEDARLADMTLYFDNGTYSLYCDPVLGTVAYRKNATGETLFTNPYNMALEITGDTTSRSEIMAQIILKYRDAENNEKTLNSYTDAALKGQLAVKKIKGGLRVEYAIGEISARVLLPRRIEVGSFEENIYDPMREKNVTAANTLRQWYSTKPSYDEKRDLYYYSLDKNAKARKMRELEKLILDYCPQYSFEKMDEDYDLLGYTDDSTAAPIFRLALEYRIDEYGLVASVSGNGLRYDETAYRILEFSILPYMGACYKQNEGYSFYPDGSGTLYKLNTETAGILSRVYGNDYSFFKNLIGIRTQIMRVPVFGQVETDATTGISRGYVGFIEEGETLATLELNHSKKQFSSVIPKFLTRPYDTPQSSSLSVYAYRRYVGDYRLRYIILSDDTKAAAAGLSSYYECSWMGMAIAYRTYLDTTSDTFNRLTADTVQSSIPLYIETFGCVDTIKKIASVPVTVSVALTSFEDISEMYAYLAGKNVTNVNFQLKGYANGGMYAEVPYKLKWQSSVGGKSGFKALLAEAKEKGFGIYPDFDFVYTSGGGENGRALKLKKNAARTIDNRYTTKRVYSVTQQSNISFFQVVLSPATYSKFYEKTVQRYSKYEDAVGVSLSTFGSDLNSDFDENKTVLREEAKQYVIRALSYFKQNNYSVMVNGGNAYTWSLADHILDVPLDSSRYKTEYRMVPFIGVVLHGYVSFAGTALNMEGNLTYAMLKAIESGAGLYFILSYENTALLKENTMLSQNYSVRYDIWRSRLVDIYQELNAVLADVQTKLIIDHQFLDASRVPDTDELLKDIADETELRSAEIEAQKAQEVARAVAISQTLTKMTDYKTAIDGYRVQIDSGRRVIAGADGALVTAWNTAVQELDANDQLTTATRMALTNALSTYVIAPYTKARRISTELDQLVLSTKQNYDALVRADVAADVLNTARDAFEQILDLYAAIKSVWESETYAVSAAAKAAYIDGQTVALQALEVTTAGTALSVSNADVTDFLFRDNATVNAHYAGVGIKEIEAAYKAALADVKLYDPDNNAIVIDYDATLCCGHRLAIWTPLKLASIVAKSLWNVSTTLLNECGHYVNAII